MIAIAVAAGGCGEVAEEPLEVERAAIIHGREATENPFNAAIYHMAVDRRSCSPPYLRPYNGWWTRPCSGTVIKRTATETYVLTARHCVTETGTIHGHLLTGTSNLRVTTDLAPGPVPVLWLSFPFPGNYVPLAPPANAVAAGVFAADPAELFDVGADLAIVRVSARLPLPDARRFAVYRGPHEDLMGRPLWAWGYGRNRAGDCDYDIASGAGTLRFANWFTIGVSTPTYYSFRNTSDTGAQEIWVGDSGGGSFAVHPLLGYWILTGVHSLISGVDAYDAGGANLADWLQAKLGALYLMSLTEFPAGSRVVGAFVGAGAPLTYHLTGDSFRTRITFVRETGQLRMGAAGAAGGVFCAQDNFPDPNVTLAACSPAASQSWSLSADMQIQNDGTGQCLRAAAGGAVTTGSCEPSSSSRWVWLTYPQP